MFVRCVRLVFDHGLRRCTPIVAFFGLLGACESGPSTWEPSTGTVSQRVSEESPSSLVPVGPCRIHDPLELESEKPAPVDESYRASPAADPPKEAIPYVAFPSVGPAIIEETVKKQAAFRSESEELLLEMGDTPAFWAKLAALKAERLSD